MRLNLPDDYVSIPLKEDYSVSFLDFESLPHWFGEGDLESSADDGDIEYAFRPLHQIGLIGEFLYSYSGIIEQVGEGGGLNP